MMRHDRLTADHGVMPDGVDDSQLTSSNRSFANLLAIKAMLLSISLLGRDGYLGSIRDLVI
jgi:hypothetical protein